MLSKIIEVNEDENRFSLKSINLKEIPSTERDISSKIEKEKDDVLKDIQEDSVYTQ